MTFPAQNTLIPQACVLFRKCQHRTGIWQEQPSDEMHGLGEMQEENHGNQKHRTSVHSLVDSHLGRASEKFQLIRFFIFPKVLDSAAPGTHPISAGHLPAVDHSIPCTVVKQIRESHSTLNYDVGPGGSVVAEWVLSSNSSTTTTMLYLFNSGKRCHFVFLKYLMVS